MNVSPFCVMVMPFRNSGMQSLGVGGSAVPVVAGASVDVDVVGTAVSVGASVDVTVVSTGTDASVVLGTGASVEGTAVSVEGTAVSVGTAVNVVSVAGVVVSVTGGSFSTGELVVGSGAGSVDGGGGGGGGGVVSSGPPSHTAWYDDCVLELVLVWNSMYAERWSSLGMMVYA